MDTQADWVVIPRSGATFAVREELGRLGCQWDKASRRWLCPPAVAEQALRAVELQGNDLEDMSPRYQQELQRRWAERSAGKAAQEGR